MRRFQENKETILKVELELCPQVRKRLYKEKLGSGKWLACWTGHAKFEVKMGLRVSLWTWLNTSVVVGNERSPAYLVAMTFHAFFSIEKMLKNM